MELLIPVLVAALCGLIAWFFSGFFAPRYREIIGAIVFLAVLLVQLT